LPPDLVDAESEEGKAMFAGSASNPATPVLEGGLPSGALATPGSLFDHLSNLASTPESPATPGSPVTPGSPAMPGSFRAGHRRHASLGTTKTSPSTRRRSIEGTMALIKEAVDPNGEGQVDGDWAKIANNLAGAEPAAPQS
jgi:serine/threonine-protein phosphatase 2B catalytic subunit